MWFKSMQGSGPEANPTGKRRMRSYATSIARDAGAYRPDGGSRFPSERSKLYSLAIFSLPSTRALGQSDHVEHHFDAKESAKSFDDPARDAWQIPDRVIAGLNLKRTSRGRLRCWHWIFLITVREIRSCAEGLCGRHRAANGELRPATGRQGRVDQRNCRSSRGRSAKSTGARRAGSERGHPSISVSAKRMSGSWRNR